MPSPIGDRLFGGGGGPVVDRDGRLIGILVRATDGQGVTQYVRAVRMSWVAHRLVVAFDGLGPTDQEAIGSYLEPMD